MKLIRFRVTEFRSVTDSGWIDVDDVTALIGTNESGKTNLLLPLWKLNPAKNGEVKPTSDFPRKRYNAIRHEEPKPVFIQAEFTLDDELATEVAQMTNAPVEQLGRVLVSRDLAGDLQVTFPDAPVARHVAYADISGALDVARTDLAGARAGTPEEEETKQAMLAAVDAAISALSDASNVDAATLDVVSAPLFAVTMGTPPKRSSIAPVWGRLTDKLSEFTKRVREPGPNESERAHTLIQERMPRFVYYSNYGNLDSEIYLPHVLENLNRDDLGTKEEAKARTLKVLFDFVRLSPQEILDLGKEYRPPQGNPHQSPTDAQISEVAERKRERSILLQSAGTELTERFRGWWKQGDYRFRFEADGNHFRIWVSDERRPEEIELENRSTGLQWFLSFFLVFLVESGDEHSGAILLLDEPGHSLHPLAQRDLSAFFNSLATQNQLLYTTHSPFLVDADRLDRVKAVFVNEDGSTGISGDLRAAERTVAGSAQSKSIYPVHAALNLTASDTLLLGCDVVIVEGTSDQIYLSAIKNLLIGAGRLQPKREIVFLPAGGVRGVGAIAAITSGQDGQLPPVLLDGDRPGVDFATKLRTSLYQGQESRVHLVTDMIKMPNAEVEDLVPPEMMHAVISRWLRQPETLFEDVAKTGEPLVGQIETYAKTNGLTLASPGWKVDLARQTRPRLQALTSEKAGGAWMDCWAELFARLLG